MLIPIEVIYVFAFLFYIASASIHILVLKKKISYKSVNGGRSKNYTEQQKQSQISIVILMILLLYVVSSLIFPQTRTTVIYLVITSITVLFWFLGTILQLLGTKFEKRIVFWINLVGLLSHLGLVLVYFE